jgi:type VI protein secretion system component Hcp
LINFKNLFLDKFNALKILIMKKILINGVYTFLTLCGITILQAQNVGIGTSNPVNQLHILNSLAANGGAEKGLLIENSSTTTGEAAVVFKNAGLAGTGSKNWYIGLNQNPNFSWSYGTAFTNAFTKMVLDSTGSLGLGTINPNNSAIADFTSSNKGILLPRLSDTTAVTSPAAGLVIYNQTTKTPNYYDGVKWNNLESNNSSMPLQGSLTYTISGISTIGGISVDAGQLSAIDYGNSSFIPSSGGGGGGGAIGKPTNADSIVIFKEFDGNSIIFKRAHLGGLTIPTMEISQFLPGASSPFYSIKLTDFTVSSQSFFISEKTGKLTERYSLKPTRIGYKDWVNNKSFSYNITGQSFGVY